MRDLVSEWREKGFGFFLDREIGRQADREIDDRQIGDRQIDADTYKWMFQKSGKKPIILCV